MSARLEWLLDLVAPRRCLGCDAIGTAAFCDQCGPPAPPDDDEPLNGIPIFSMGRYSGALANAVRRFKYEPSPALAKPLGLELARVIQPAHLSSDSVLVPVPLHPTRLVERGFNQSALLARALGKRVGLAVSPHALERNQQTGRQARLGRAERLDNVARAFSAAAHVPRRAVLVDDVVTTGATVMTCVQVLTALDVDVVAIVAIARTAGRFRIS